MKAPIGWLGDYVDINLDTKGLADAMTLSGSKVEGIESLGEDISQVVVGRILSLGGHPDADRLQIAKVDVGDDVIQIVTGAKNITVGDCVPIALVGATLSGGIKISKGKLRGVESFGMMCSIEELGLCRHDFPDAPEDGVYILNNTDQPGMDIKGILGMDEETIEFEITSNRPDCLSVIGLAREAAATLGTSFKKPIVSLREEADDASKYIAVEIQDKDLCERYTARVVKNVRIAPSPRWMRNRLKASGIRPINNIVDITNYVMLEYGQPMHAYDIRDIKDNKIVVRRAKDGEIIKTLDDQERILDPATLVIADGERTIGVAGVMGGANTEVREDTNTIVFESANFNGSAIRLAAKKLGMRTEASGRFEKGLDVENVHTAINRAAELVEQLGVGTVCKGVIDCYEKRKGKRSIKLRPSKINELLGTNIKKDKMIDILNMLEFRVERDDMLIDIPSFRDDIELEADIAEEIARFYGYNNIEPTLLSGKAATLGRRTPEQRIENLIKNTMISCGLSEIYTYSFTSPKVFEKLNLEKDNGFRNAIFISNPLGEDYSVMRTTTIPSMLSVISTNYNRRTESGSFFEISNVYIPKKLPLHELPHEKPQLTIGMYGETDFYVLKGIVEELLLGIGVENYDILPERKNVIFHPGRTAILNIKDEPAGIIGEIHPEVAEKFGCPQRTYIGILEVESLIKNTSLKPEYYPLPKFPAVTRDMALIVRDDILVKQIEDIIRQRAGKILEEIRLFDVYKGKQVAEGMKSVAYSITFRAADKTLTDKEVNKAMAKILHGIKTNLGAELRE